MASGSGRLDLRLGEDLPDLTVEVTARMVIMGAAATRDWQPQHHDRLWAQEHAGTEDIFLNAVTLNGFIERYVRDWCGPFGRIGKLSSRIRRPISVGDTMRFRGAAIDRREHDGDWYWIDVAVNVTTSLGTAVEALVILAIPGGDLGASGPWSAQPETWKSAVFEQDELSPD